MRVAVLLVIGGLGCGGGPNPGTGSDGPGGDDDDGPAGGDDAPGTGVDAPPDPCNPGMWCTETSPVNTSLRGVFAIDLNKVIAVGNGGVILQRRDNAWTQMTSGTTEDLQGVWAASGSDIWVVGKAGTILRYDGTSWAPFGSFTKEFRAVWGSGTDDVFIAGVGGVEHFTGGTTFVTQALAGVLGAISGSSPTDVWVTGESAKVDHYTGTWTTNIDPGTASSTYFGLLALGPTEVWISTFANNKETLRFDGAWVPHSATSGTVFQGFYAVSGTDIWAAGGTRAGHWDGSSWTIETPAGAGANMLGLGGIGSSLWVVGNNGLILHRR